MYSISARGSDVFLSLILFVWDRSGNLTTSACKL
jgi:hypothetical protein